MDSIHSFTKLNSCNTIFIIIIPFTHYFYHNFLERTHHVQILPSQNIVDTSIGSLSLLQAASACSTLMGVSPRRRRRFRSPRGSFGSIVLGIVDARFVFLGKNH